MTTDAETLWTAPGHITARWRGIFLQVRSGVMTLEALDAIETAARLMRAQRRRGEERYGAMIVVKAGAPPVVGESAHRQRQLLASLHEDERLHVAVVLEGEGVGAITQRVLARAILRTKRRQICHSVPEAAGALLDAIGAPEGEVGELVSYVESLKGRL